MVYFCPLPRGRRRDAIEFTAAAARARGERTKWSTTVFFEVLTHAHSSRRYADKVSPKKKRPKTVSRARAQCCCAACTEIIRVDNLRA